MKHTTIVCALLLLVSGCVTERGAFRWMDNHPGRAGEYCNKTFPLAPVHDSVNVHSDTATGKQEPGAMVNVNCDSLKAALIAAGKGETKYVQVQCPPCPPPTTVTNTVYHEKTVESTAKLAAQRDSFNREQAAIMKRADSIGKENVKLTKDVKRLQHGRNNWRLIALIIIAYRVAIFFLSKYLPFLKVLP